MPVTPLIDPDSVRQVGLHATAEMPTRGRTAARGTLKGVVQRVYPVGHPENPRGQIVVDVRPVGERRAVLRGVPVAFSLAHADTYEALPASERRQPFEPRPRGRLEGSTRDMRPGTYVLVAFIGGELYEPVVIGSFKPNEQGASGFPFDRQVVDRAAGAKGELDPTEVAALDSELDGYPCSVDAYNGVRREVDNRGSYYVQTGLTREKIFQGHNGIPASPEPEGNVGFSTRGAPNGTIAFTTGRHPRFPDEESPGRQHRKSIDADDGTIRDDTSGSGKGNWVARLKSTVGRFFVSTKGSGDGRLYLEGTGGGYVEVNGSTVTIHGASKVVLDGGAVHLGGPSTSDPVTLHPQLMAMMQALVTIFDTHVHSGGTLEGGLTGLSEIKQTTAFSAQKDASKASGVLAAETNPSEPDPQSDPDGESA